MFKILNKIIFAIFIFNIALCFSECRKYFCAKEKVDCEYFFHFIIFPLLIYVLYSFGLHAVSFTSFHFLVCVFFNQFGFFQLVRVFIAYANSFWIKVLYFSHIMSNRDSNNCTGSNANISPEKKVSKRRSRNFQEAFLDEFPLWREWVVRLEDISKFYCRICDKTLECGTSQILNHEITAGHP